ncbi:MAG: tRNA (adenosine(37)-N6)-dimethylallyltransferase MiaA [Candidatus Wolfebacteria bacterium]|nr:tRNA (adenosine(37)-N6)-dimethylallyltransferase MiaA [Candidatus Wolfebacteria bacterium]
MQKKLSSSSKVLVIVGPTASGKSEVAVRLAKKFNGEIISADSRQVYRHLNIGTGKIPRDQTCHSEPKARNLLRSFSAKADQDDKQICYFYKGVRHHLIDVASPRRTFTVVRYQKLARKALQDILEHGKLPIIAGGTGFYIDALLSNQSFPPVPPQPKLRRDLEQLSTEELFERLKKIDKKRAETIDKKNKRRLVRALEIALAPRGRGVFFPQSHVWELDSRTLKMGILVEREELKKKIGKRLRDRLKKGMIEEVQNLRKPFNVNGAPAFSASWRIRTGRYGLSWKRLDDLGLEYRYVSRYLRGVLSYEEMVEQLERAIFKYAKRQMTWFRRDKNIRWVRTYKEAEKLVRDFLR